MFKMKCTEMVYSIKTRRFTSHNNNVSIIYKCYNHFINKLLYEVIKLGPYILDISKMYGPFVY